MSERLMGQPPQPERAYETQIIEFASADGLASYMADERRSALASARDAAIMRTELQYVELVRTAD